jgi:hypothetical protein
MVYLGNLKGCGPTDTTHGKRLLQKRMTLPVTSALRRVIDGE